MIDAAIFNIDEIAAALTDDKDQYIIDTDDHEATHWPQLPDAMRGTWTFRLRIEDDDLTPKDIEDDEVFGRYEIAYDGRMYVRPADFTGAAVKFWDHCSQGVEWWYEPPKTLRRYRGSGFKTIEEWETAKANNLRYVEALISWGYISIGVKVTHVRADGYTRSWSEWIGGVENSLVAITNEDQKNHDLYVAEIVKEQLAEVIDQINQEATA